MIHNCPCGCVMNVEPYENGIIIEEIELRKMVKMCSAHRDMILYFNTLQTENK